MMHSQFRVRMKGKLAGQLSEFLEQAGLERCGRLDDDFDQVFGQRELRTRQQGWVKLTLLRGFTDDDWKVKLTYEKDPLPADEAEALRRKVLDAAVAAGMTITAGSGVESPITPRQAGMRYFVTADQATGWPLFVVRIDDQGRVQVYSLAGPGWVDAPEQGIRDDVVHERGWMALADGEVDAMLARLQVGPGHWLTVTHSDAEPKLLVRSLDGCMLEGYSVSSARWEPMGYPPNPSLNDPTRWQPVAVDDVAQVQGELHMAWDLKEASVFDAQAPELVDTQLTEVAVREGIVGYVIEILRRLPDGLVVGFQPPGGGSSGSWGSGPMGPGGSWNFEVGYRVWGFPAGANYQVFDAFKGLFDAWGWSYRYEDRGGDRHLDARTGEDSRRAFHVTVSTYTHG